MVHDQNDWISLQDPVFPGDRPPWAPVQAITIHNGFVSSRENSFHIHSGFAKDNKHQDHNASHPVQSAGAFTLIMASIAFAKGSRLTDAESFHLHSEKRRR